jgi:3-methyladenine DNA glycosylase AlkD
MTATMTRPAPSGTTARANAFVAERLPAAAALGTRLADHTNDPAEFAAELRAGLLTLADPEYADGQRHVAPGIGSIVGVRRPLLAEIHRGFARSTRHDRTTTWLFLVDRLLREPDLELRWFSFGLLARTLVDEPERTWQLVRRAAREAADWITIDDLAHVAGKGILAEPYRWAELEQLVYSPSRWERRLVGSTVATIPFVDRQLGREPVVVRHGLELIGQLIGDAEPDVQKSLAWALRGLILVDEAAVADFCMTEAATAAANDDGHRAWVIRDAISKLSERTASSIRSRLNGIRRRPGSPSTSTAAEAAQRFGSGMLGRPRPEPPLA